MVAVPVLDLFTKKQLIYNYIEKKLPDEEISRPPFRFSWEYKNPPYYEWTGQTAKQRDAIVGISDRIAPSLPENIQQKIAKYRNSIYFKLTDFILLSVYCDDLLQRCKQKLIVIDKTK